MQFTAFFDIIFLGLSATAQYGDTTSIHTTQKTDKVALTIPMFTGSTSAVANEPQFAPLAESEVQPEGETTPKSEVQPEGETTPKSEVQPEGETSPESEVQPEGETTPKSETVSEPEVEAEVRPSDVEIVLPPMALIAVIVIGSFILSLVSHSSRKNSRNARISTATSRQFFSDFDREVIDSLVYNTPGALFQIALPALLSLALCPFTLYLYQPFTRFLWPPEQHATPPNINDAISCFLAPAGLVYATSFGFAFQQALTKQQHIMSKITTEISMVDQIATFVDRMTLSPTELKCQIYRAVKSEAIFMILQLVDREPTSYKCDPREDVKVRIWTIIDILRNAPADDTHHVNRLLCEKIISHILKLNSICSDRIGVLHSRIHPVKWTFLETLGFFSFIGVLLLQASSYRMELVMCIITVFSISMLCYVVSDLDSPFSGFFRVDLSVMYDMLTNLERRYLKALPTNSMNSSDVWADSPPCCTPTTSVTTFSEISTDL